MEAPVTAELLKLLLLKNYYSQHKPVKKGLDIFSILKAHYDNEGYRGNQSKKTHAVNLQVSHAILSQSLITSPTAIVSFLFLEQECFKPPIPKKSEH